MDLIDSKFVGFVSPRLEKFKRIKPDLYNFRCPICGDSRKHRNKARGYIYTVKANTNFKCHNCGASMSFNNFLKQIDPALQKEYSMEKFKEGFTGRGFVVEEPKFDKDFLKQPVFKSRILLPLCSEVHGPKKYLEDRGLDSTKFYYAEKFKEFVNERTKSCDPDRPLPFQQGQPDEERIIIPLYYKKKLIGVQGRSLGASLVKYITTMFLDDVPKIYGLDEINDSKPVYIVEGPFDSTFIQNAVAMCGSDVDIGSFDWSDYIYVYDNEPRNREIVNRISKTIDRGDKVVIWPTNIHEKDINDMVLAGHDVQSVVECNVYSGLKAKLQFNTWKRV